MVNTNALRGLIVSKGLTQEKVAAHLGITPKTFGTRMKRGVFGSDEIEAMIELLDKLQGGTYENYRGGKNA